MGQTLSHGVYLPNEGERNCYAGLASNWQILNTAVGNIAEKAPLVHTHGNITNDGKVGTTANLPLITGTGGAVQAGSFGNQANTFCEGNDSRLSDARTPVAHTHTKSDVTDLFNTANVWSGQNTFSDHTYIYGQWKGLYFKNPEVTAGVAPSGDKRNYISFIDANGYNLGAIILNVIGANSTWLQTGVSAKDINDSSQSVYCGTQYRVYGNGEKYFSPATNGDVYLGTSTLQWKSVYARSFNEINPGALSLPNLDSDGYIDLSDNISANSEYLYTPVYDGWLALYVQTTGFHAENAVGIFNKEYTTPYRWNNTVTSSINLLRAGTYHGAVILPVRAGTQYGCWVVVNSSTALAPAQLFFYKAKGNV